VRNVAVSIFMSVEGIKGKVTRMQNIKTGLNVLCVVRSLHSA
jgi:hypothetical protein